MPKKIERRQSSIHGNGVFATAPIAKGERVVRYKGEVRRQADVDAEYARLKAAGAIICEEMKDKPWGERSFVMDDPNGIHLYIYKSIPPTPEYQKQYDLFK